MNVDELSGAGGGGGDPPSAGGVDSSPLPPPTSLQEVFQSSLFNKADALLLGAANLKEQLLRMQVEESPPPRAKAEMVSSVDKFFERPPSVWEMERMALINVIEALKKDKAKDEKRIENLLAEINNLRVDLLKKKEKYYSSENNNHHGTKGNDGAKQLPQQTQRKPLGNANGRR